MSPKACLAITTDSFQWLTNFGIFFRIIGSLNIVPLIIFLIVPLGEGYFSFNLYSLTLFSSGVIVAHLTPVLCLLIASAAS